jgi:hypothetical protein
MGHGASLDGGVWWYRREVAVEGWRPVEDLVRWGFAHAPVVMANEGQAPPPLDDWAGVDAFVVSTDNEMTEDGA